MTDQSPLLRIRKASVEAPEAEVAAPELEGDLGTGLALSGGGYRAALFHLGALRRLNEIGRLGEVTSISAVSGGAILAAHLTAQVGTDWPEAGERIDPARWIEAVVDPFREVAACNIRTTALLKTLLPGAGAAVSGLVAEYGRLLTLKPLTELPERPRFIFGAAELTRGKFFTFDRENTGYAGDSEAVWASDRSIAFAVGASSCFPPVFAPMHLVVGNRIGLRLSDGGVVDNSGVEGLWRTHRRLLISDAGATFDADWKYGRLRVMKRYYDVKSEQASRLMRRWLQLGADGNSNRSFASWTTAGDGWPQETLEPDALAHYPDETIERIRAIRTDLDAFSKAEMSILENHGYLSAARELRARSLDTPSSGPPADVNVPYPDFGPGVDQARLRKQLADSHRSYVLGRPHPRIPIFDYL